MKTRLIIRSLIALGAIALTAQAASPANSTNPPKTASAANQQAEIDALLKQQAEAQGRFQASVDQHRQAIHAQAPGAHQARAAGYSAQSVSASGQVSLSALRNIAAAVAAQARNFKGLCDTIAGKLDFFGAHLQATQTRNAGNNAVALSNLLSNVAASARVGQRVNVTVPGFATINATVVP